MKSIKIKNPNKTTTFQIAGDRNGSFEIGIKNGENYERATRKDREILDKVVRIKLEEHVILSDLRVCGGNFFVFFVYRVAREEGS